MAPQVNVVKWILIQKASTNIPFHPISYRDNLDLTSKNTESKGMPSLTLQGLRKFRGDFRYDPEDSKVPLAIAELM